MTDFLRHRRTNPEDEQRERIERWYHRLRSLPADADETTVRDFALVVLQQCDAMRDWLLHAPEVLAARDPSRPSKSIEHPTIPPKEIQALYQTPELRICRSIVDGAKHLTLDNPKHIDPKIVGDVMSRPRGGPPYPPPAVDLTPAFNVNGQNYKVVDLCTTCVMRIRGFLRKHGRGTPQMGHDPDTRKGFIVECPEGTPWP
jgi:hypothetical protein